MDTPETPRPDHPLARLTAPGPLARLTMAPPPRAAATAAPTAPNPRVILRGLMRHWWQALAIWLVGTTGLAAAIYVKYQPVFQSFSLLKVEPQGQNLFDSLSRDSNHIATQVQMILSPRVLSQAILGGLQGLEILRESPDAETKLRSLIGVEPIGGTYLIRVSATTPDPSVSATIVNAVVDAFKDAEGELSSRTINEQIAPLEKAERTLKNQIDSKQTTWKELVSKMEAPPEWIESQLRAMRSAEAGLEQIERETTDKGKSTIDLSQYAKLQGELLDLELDLTEARIKAEKLQLDQERGDLDRLTEAEVERVFLEDPDVLKVANGIQEVEDNLAQMASRVDKKSDPAYRRLYEERKALARAYEQLWAAKEPRIRKALAAGVGGPKAGLVEAKAKVASLVGRIDAIKGKLSTIQIESRKTGEKSIEIAILTTELNREQAMLNRVMQRLEQLRFDRTSSDKIIVIDAARPIYVPLNNKRNKMLAMAPVGMLGLVMGLFTLLELRGGRVGSADELSSRMPVEVYSVPPLPVVRPSRGLKDSRTNEAKFEAFVQQLDHIRVALCGEAAQHPGRGRCVLITSATGGEGKTTLGAQLAVRCAEAGARTVLIDADLRRPTLGKLFEVPECPGLSDVLREEAALDDALVPISQVGGCQLLPAGSPEPNPNRVLRGQQFAPMLEQLRRSYDVIIIDTPPVLPVPDALIMGRYADGVVLAARHDRSRFPLVERANTLLAGAGIPVLGVVINGVRPSGTRYGQYAYGYQAERPTG